MDVVGQKKSMLDKSMSLAGAWDTCISGVAEFERREGYICSHRKLLLECGGEGLHVRLFKCPR
jgi:hypothetical protein